MISRRGKGNLSKKARKTELNPTTYSIIEKWSKDPILVSKGFDFIATKYPSVFGHIYTDLRTRCRNRAYYLVAKLSKVEGYNKIGPKTSASLSTAQINQLIKKLGIVIQPTEIEMMHGNNGRSLTPQNLSSENEARIVDIDVLYNDPGFMGGLKMVVKKRTIENVVVQLVEFTIPVVDCNDMKNVKAELVEDEEYLLTRIRIKDPIIPTCKWKNSLQRNMDVKATQELHEREPGDPSKRVYYCEDTFQKEAAFECKLKSDVELQFKYTTIGIRSSTLGPNIVLTNKYFNPKNSAHSDTRLDCKLHLHAGKYNEKVQRTGEVSFIAVIEKSVTELTAPESFTEEEEAVTETFFEDCTHTGPKIKTPSAQVDPPSTHSGMDLEEVQVATHTKETKTPYSRAGASKKTPPPIGVCASGMYCRERDVPITDSNFCFICMKFVHAGCTVNDAQQSTCCIMCEPVAPTATTANATGNTSATANATASTVEQRQPDQDVSGMQTDFDNTATGNTSSTSTRANANATATATGNTTSTSTASTVEQRQPDQAVSGMQTDFNKLLITQKQRIQASLVVSQAQRNQADFEKGQSRPGPGEQAGKRSRIINVSGSVYSKEAEHQATHQDTPSLPLSVPSVMDFSHKSNDVCSKEARQRESEHQATHQDTPSLPASSVPSVMDSSHKSNDVCRFAKRKNVHRVDVRSDINNLLYVDVLPTPSGLDLLSSPKSVGRDDATNEELTPSIPYGPLFPDVPASTDDSTDSGSIFSFDESELEEDTKLIGEHEPPPPPSELEEDMNTVREHEPPPKGKKLPQPRKISPRNHQAKHKKLKNRAIDFVEIWNKGGGVNSNDLKMSLTASKPAARKDKGVSPIAFKKIKKISSTASNSSRRRTRSQSQSTRRGRSTTPRSKQERTTLEQEIENIEEQAKAELLKELKDMEEQQE